MIIFAEDVPFRPFRHLITSKSETPLNLGVKEGGLLFDKDSDHPAVNVTVNLSGLDIQAILNKINEIHRDTQQILHKELQLSAQLDALTAQVAANGTVIGSAIVLLQGLKAALDAAGTDPVALQALSDSLASTDTQLAAAVAANTPAASA